MLKFYFNGSPNPLKVTLFLEESGLAFQPVPVDAFRGDQFKPDYLADRFTFTSGLDDEGRRHMFKHLQTAGS